MITLLNADPDTGNQGLGAEHLSAVAGQSALTAEGVAVADHGSRRRQVDVRVDIDAIKEQVQAQPQYKAAN